jgi:Recombination endonuclease VII
MASSPEAEAERRRRISETRRRQSGRSMADEQPKPCACGCGELATVNKKTGKARTWKLGHDNRRQLDAQGRLCCYSCQEYKPLAEFGPNKAAAHGARTRCRKCESESSMAWTDRNYDKTWDARLRRNFGITLEQYRQMFAEQGGVCAICGEPPKVVGYRPSRRQGRPRRPMLVVDHDHVTGKIRGLLCIHCNRGIGFLKDSADIVRFALKYLEERGEQQWP